MGRQNLAYMAAVLDTKGDFQFGLGYTGFLPSIRIVSPHKEWLKKLQEWFPEFNYPKDWSSTKNRRSYYIYVSKMEDIIRILKTVEGELILKHEQARLMREFCASRMLHPYTPYTLSELQMVYQFKIAKGKPVLFERLESYLKV